MKQKKSSNKIIQNNAIIFIKQIITRRKSKTYYSTIFFNILEGKIIKNESLLSFYGIPIKKDGYTIGKTLETFKETNKKLDKWLGISSNPDGIVVTQYS